MYGSDTLTIRHAAGRKLLEARWGRPVHSGELESGVQAITQRACGLGVELLLIDFRAAGVPTAADQRWRAGHLAEAHRNSPLRRSAVLLSADLLQLLVNEVILEKAGELPYELEAFLSETRARQWLFLEDEGGRP